jgi:DNA-binding beta-propeller fold protein YncE
MPVPPNPRKATRLFPGLLLAATSAAPIMAQAPAAKPDATYWIYVGAESADLIHRVRFGPDGITVEKTKEVGLYALETEGPHGLAISRDGKYLHMTTGHGLPDGMYFRYELGPDTLVGEPIPLGMFPATLDLTPDGLYAFAVNFNLYGEHVPSTVSVIYTPDNVEVARVETCTMPHGSRLDRSGIHQYSVCMMDDQLVELDTRTFDVARRFSVAKGQEGPVQQHAMADGGMDHGEHDMGGMKTPTCSPTWAQPGANGEFVYVACNKSDEILEISAADWTVTRRFATGRAPYNLAVTPDGRLLVSTLKAGKAVEFFDLSTGSSLAKTETSTTVVHGVVVSPDSRYAFVSVEGVGAEPGKVDVFDLRTFERVSSAEVGQQASGIAFWRMEAARR